LPSLRLLVPMATIGLIVASSTAFAAQMVDTPPPLLTDFVT
jgi:hypothetical protein